MVTALGLYVKWPFLWYQSGIWNDGVFMFPTPFGSMYTVQEPSHLDETALVSIWIIMVSIKITTRAYKQFSRLLDIPTNYQYSTVIFAIWYIWYHGFFLVFLIIKIYHHWCWFQSRAFTCYGPDQQVLNYQISNNNGTPVRFALMCYIRSPSPTVVITNHQLFSSSKVIISTPLEFIATLDKVLDTCMCWSRKKQ